MDLNNIQESTNRRIYNEFLRNRFKEILYKDISKRTVSSVD